MPPNTNSPDNSQFPQTSDIPTGQLKAQDTTQQTSQNPTPPPNEPTAPQNNPLPLATNAPQMPPFAAPPPNQPLQPTSPKSSPPFLLIIILLVIILPVLAIGGGLALAYNNYSFYKPPQAIQNTLDTIIATTPLPKPPRIILASTLTKSVQLKSADTKTEISISTNAQNAPVSALKLTATGPVDFQQTSSRAAETEIALEVKFEGAQFNGSASIKTIDNTIYFKVNEVPFGQFYQQLLDYKNKWYFYKVPDKYLPEDNQNQQALDKVKVVLANFFEKTQTWTTTKSTDGDVYTLEIKPPKSELDKLIFDLVDAAEPKDQKQVLTSLEKEQVSKATDKIKDLNITAKVNKSNYYLKRAEVSFNINVGDIGLKSSTIKLSPNEPLTYNVNFSTELSNYNKKIVVVPPEGAEDFQKIIDAYSHQFSQQLNQNGQTIDAAIKNDIGALATELQAYYTTPGNGFYPKDLDELVKTGLLKKIPAPPANSGIDAYQYIKDPTVCDGTTTNPCREAALFAPLSNPTKIGNGWCWQSTTGEAQELPKEQCTAAKTQASDSDSLRGLIAPSQTVLGQKIDWETQTLELFSSIFK